MEGRGHSEKKGGRPIKKVIIRLKTHKQKRTRERGGIKRREGKKGEGWGEKGKACSVDWVGYGVANTGGIGKKKENNR